jgi:hypothetical protein
MRPWSVRCWEGSCFWFLTHLRSVLRAAEGGTGALSNLVFGAGVVYTALWMTSASIFASVAYAVEVRDASVPAAIVLFMRRNETATAAASVPLGRHRRSRLRKAPPSQASCHRRRPTRTPRARARRDACADPVSAWCSRANARCYHCSHHALAPLAHAAAADPVGRGPGSRRKGLDGCLERDDRRGLAPEETTSAEARCVGGRRFHGR